MQSIESDPSIAAYTGRFKRKMSAPTVTRHKTNDAIECVSTLQHFHKF